MTQLELKLANSNSGGAGYRTKLTWSTILVFSGGTCRGFLPQFAVCWWWSHTAHARMTESFVSPRLVTNWTAHCELLMWLTELNMSVYRTGWHLVWRTLRKTLTMIFSVVSYIMKIMFYIRCYGTKRPWLWTATPTPWTWAILASNDAKRNFINRQLHKISLGTNFSTSQLSIV